MQEVYITGNTNLSGPPPATESTQSEIGAKLSDIKDILLTPAAIVLPGLNDVNIDNPTDGQHLIYNITTQKWENIVPEGATGYVDRGDPSSWDFAKTDLTADGQYHTLDLSNIVPEGATIVHLLIHALTASNNSLIIFRKKGNVNEVNREILYVHHGNSTYLDSKWVTCDADRKIEYWTTNVVWTSLDITVRGWM